MNVEPYDEQEDRAQLKMGGYWDSIVTFGIIALMLLLMTVEVLA